MTSVVNYAVSIALAILVAAGASLIYVIYVHLTTPASAPPPTVTNTPTPTAQPTSPATETTPAEAPPSRILSATLYVATPEVLRCANLSSSYLYYLNITVDRKRLEDPVTHYVFRVVTSNGTHPLETASLLSLNGEFFEGYNSSVTQRLGNVSIYLELKSEAPLEVREVKYLATNATHLIDRAFYISCVEMIEFRGDYNVSRRGPGNRGLVPADRSFAVNVTLPPGRYRAVAETPDVRVMPEEVVGGGDVTFVISLLNRPQVYNKTRPLVINLVKVQEGQ
mgnify:CR=1 FL=1